MSDETNPEGGPGTPRSAASQATRQSGVLGNLPRSRPAVRSPRRADPPTEAAPSDPPEAAAEQPKAADGNSSPADLEALARGGLAVAGGAASLGLRLAGRAASALRDAVERR